MFGFLKRLFQPSKPRLIEKCPMTEPRDCKNCQLNYICVDPIKDEEPEPKPTIDRMRPVAGPDIIARQGGQKRNRYHIYKQPHGYPIRCCDWIGVERESLDDVREIPGKEAGMAIQILKGDQTKRVCSHCLAIARGKRGEGIIGNTAKGA